jgi:hypothetical protein
MKKILSSVVLIVASHFVQAQSTLDVQLNAAAKQAGAQAAGTMMGRTPKVDAQGQVVLDANGKPVMQAMDAEGLRGGLRMFQEITGLEGVASVSAPGQEARTGQARIAVKKSFQFACSGSSTPGPFSTGPLAFMVESCQTQPGSTTVAAVKFLVCENAAKAGTCDTAADYTRKITVTSGQYSQLDTASLGLGCNAAGVCLLSMSGEYSIGGNDAALREKAGAVMAGSNVLVNLRDNVLGQDYDKKVTAIGTPLAECARANEKAAQSGLAVTCGENPQTIQLAATQSDAQCSGARQCEPNGWATTVTKFTKTCNRIFPVTKRTTNLSFPYNVTCDIVTPLDPDEPQTNSCNPKDEPSKTTGMYLIGGIPEKCTGGLNTKKQCLSTTRIEFWAKITDPKTLGQTASPARIGGACDTSPSSQARTTSCTEWFGRTLGFDDCTDTAFSGSAAIDATFIGLSFLQRPGCGFCVAPTINEPCYAATDPTESGQAGDSEVQDSCASLDLNNCSLSSAGILNYAGPGSALVTGQVETYSCQSEVRQCTKWAPQDASCLVTDMAQGMDKLAVGGGRLDGSFNNAMVAAATVDGTARGIEGPQSGAIPLLFTGEALKCRRPAGSVGQFLQQNCCRADLERPTEGNVIKGGCEMPEARLAAARRSGYASYRGEYCSSKVKTWFFSYCLEMSSSYCVYPGILPKLVQEQGREQLATLTASSINAEIQRASFVFSYYDTTPNASAQGATSGSWSPMIVVNGVRMSAWQWPSYCATPEIAAQLLISDPNAKSCPGVVSSWVATCDVATGCGDLPPDPTKGAFNWTLKNLNPLELETTAISKFAVVKGACNTATSACSYEVSAWPVGVGGRAVVSKDILWDLFGNAPPAASEGAPSAAVYQLNNMGDLMFKGYPSTGLAVGAMPASVRMDFSSDGGQTWVTLAIPTSGLETQELTIPKSDVIVTGSCDLSRNLCNYRVTGTVSVTAKSWGTPENPDCSGFTPGQMAVLDFAKMDLSEWLATVMDKLSGSNPKDLAGQAGAQFAAFNALYQSGSVKASAPTSANFARIVPSEGFGPFTASLSVGGYWPEVTGDPAKDTDKVTQVEVDWGTCDLPELLKPVEAALGMGFRGSKRYNAPNSYPCKPNFEKPGNFIHIVTLKVTTTKSGIQTRTVSVENAWSKFPGANSNNDYVPTGTTVDTPTKKAAPPTVIGK